MNGSFFLPNMDDFGLPISNRPDRKVVLSDQHLTSLQTFICAAQRLSFLTAAEYLCITPSAVSHRVRKLEKQLGFALFHRLPRQLKLTDEGERLYLVLKDVFDRVNTEIQDIRSNELSAALNIFSHPSVASDWLIPRLNDFSKRYPSIQVNLRTGNEQADFQTQAIDVAIYYSNGHFHGLNSEKFMEEESFPVCSLEYARQQDLLEKPENLQNCTLLHDAKAWHYSALDAEWQMWADQVGADLSEVKSFMSFDNARSAAFAAVYHAGIAMGRLRLMSSWLQSKALVAPFPSLPALKNTYHYYAVWPKHHQLPRKLDIFIDWLKQKGIQSEQEGQSLKVSQF